MMKTAIVAVSYGVRDAEEMRRSVYPAEHAIRSAFSDHAFFPALACPETVSFLRERGEDVRGLEDALNAAKKGGFDEVLVVPLLLARGTVYEAVRRVAAPFPMTGPLLEDDGNLARIADIYGAVAEQTGRDVLLMGHGNSADGDAAYERLADVLPGNVHLACRTGRRRLEDVLPALQAGTKRLLLMPLMLTSGSHARREMAGEDEGSWKNRLTRLGFDVEVSLSSMGSMPEIHRLFAERAESALKYTGRE